MSESVAMSILDLVERLQPSTVHAESDEQGRLRVVKLDLPPRATLPPEQAAIADAVEMSATAAEPSDHVRHTAIERCVDVIREVMNRRTTFSKISDSLHAGMSMAVRDDETRAALKRMIEEARVHAEDEWRRIRPALHALLEETGR